MEGMQEAFGEERVADTGIRECTIVGQGIGLAMRGLRPIAEIQYLDYLYYALADHAGRPGHGALQKCGEPARAADREDPWSPIGRDLACGKPHGGHRAQFARDARLRAEKHDRGCRDVQHADVGRRASVGGGVPQWIQE